MKIDLTKAEISAIMTALDNFVIAASWREQVQFFGHYQRALAARRASEKLRTAYHATGR